MREATIAFVRNGTWRMAAAIAFYALFTIGPLLLIVLQVTGLFMEEGDTKALILEQIEVVAGDEGSDAVEKLISNYSFPASGWMGFLMGGLTLLFGGVNMLAQISESMNHIWPEAVAGPHRRPTWLKALVQIGGVAAFGVLLICAMGLISILAYAASAVDSQITLSFLLIRWIGNLALVLFGTGVVLLLFRYLPATNLRWSSLMIGAIFTSILFIIESRILVLWFQYSGGASSYGSISWLIVFLIWGYLTAQVLLYGATFTGILDAKGNRKEPAEVSR